MHRFERFSGLSGLAVALWLVGAACGTGLETGNLQLLMTQDGSAAASIAPAFAISGSAGDVPLTSIESIVLTVVQVDLKPSSETEEEGGEWIRVPLTDPVMVDLLALPTVGGQEVAEGQVAATSFKEVRLICDGEATITLSEPVTVTGGVVIGDDEPLEQPLSIPSCESSGLKIKGATFMVPEDSESTVILEVETDATVQSINWNATGFRMSPVMKLKG
jgi:hypothetical protein